MFSSIKSAIAGIGILVAAVVSVVALLVGATLLFEGGWTLVKAAVTSPPTTEILGDVASGLIVLTATLIAGIWAFYKFHLERQSETAVDLDLHVREVAAGILFVDAVLANKGRCRIKAAGRQPLLRRKAFAKDPDRNLPFSATLDVCPFDPAEVPHSDAAPGMDWNWYAVSRDNSSPALRRFNLLDAYEFKQADGFKVDFWMEPGEVYHLSTTVRLAPGVHLARITFVSARGHDEYWTRCFSLRVPSPSDADAELPALLVSSSRTVSLRYSPSND